MNDAKPELRKELSKAIKAVDYITKDDQTREMITKEREQRSRLKKRREERKQYKKSIVEEIA